MLVALPYVDNTLVPLIILTRYLFVDLTPGLGKTATALPLQVSGPSACPRCIVFSSTMSFPSLRWSRGATLWYPSDSVETWTPKLILVAFSFIRLNRCCLKVAIRLQRLWSSWRLSTIITSDRALSCIRWAGHSNDTETVANTWSKIGETAQFNCAVYKRRTALMHFQSKGIKDWARWSTRLWNDQFHT